MGRVEDELAGQTLPPEPHHIGGEGGGGRGCFKIVGVILVLDTTTRVENIHGCVDAWTDGRTDGRRDGWMV